MSEYGVLDEGARDGVMKEQYDVVPLNDGLLIAGADGLIRFVNDRFEELFGYDQGVLEGAGVFDLLHPDDQHIAANSVGQAFGSGRLPSKTPMRIRRGDGAWLDSEISIRVVLEGPDAPFIVATVREVDLRWRSVYDALAEDAEIDVVLRRSAAAFHDGLYGMVGAIVLPVDDGLAVFPAGGLPSEFIASLSDDGPGTPWGRAARSRAEVVDDDLSFLDDVAAGIAGDLGLGRCFVYPITDPSGRLPCCLVGFLARPEFTALLGWFIRHRALTPISLALLARHRREQLVFAATRDPLTGLDNRSPFFARLREELARSVLAEGNDGSAPAVGVLLLDLDGFKQVNDELGHSVGDDLLVEVAARLRSVLRPEDLVARLGGDEFGVVCGGSPSRARLAEIAERLLQAVGAPMDLGGQVAQVGVSIGVAQGRRMSDRELLELADGAMYAAKRAGKNQVRMAGEPVDAPGTPVAVDRREA